MSFSRHEEIYRSDVKLGKPGSGHCCRRSQRSSAAMSFQSAIPWKVALRQSLPPLHRLQTILNNPRCRTMTFQQTATAPLTSCLSPRVHSKTTPPSGCASLCVGTSDTSLKLSMISAKGKGSGYVVHDLSLEGDVRWDGCESGTGSEAGGGSEAGQRSAAVSDPKKRLERSEKRGIRSKSGGRSLRQPVHSFQGCGNRNTAASLRTEIGVTGSDK